MKTKYMFFILIMSLKIPISCKDSSYYSKEWDPKLIREYNNENYYSSEKMDSRESVFHITEQKLQEVYDLALLASENKANKDIDTLLASRLQNYFSKNDTLSAPSIIHSLDSINAKFVKIELEKNLVSDSLITNDSIGIIKFKAHFYDVKRKLFSIQERQAKYILKRKPEKFKSEFKFYFSSIGKPEE